MKLILSLFAAISLLLSIQALVLPNNSNNNNSNSFPGSIFNNTQIGNNNNTNTNNDSTGACYAVYLQSLYQTLVVGGAKLRFCVQNAANDVAKSATVNQCTQNELFAISAQMNLAADKFTICLTAAAL